MDGDTDEEDLADGDELVDGDVDADGEEELADGDTGEDGDEEPFCEPSASWCEDNFLHVCNAEGTAEYVPVDCETDTCISPSDGESYCRPEKALSFEGEGEVTLFDKSLVRHIPEATIEAWLWLETPSPLPEGKTAHRIYNEGDPLRLSLAVYYNGNIAWVESGTDGWVGISTGPGTLPTGRWVHLAAIKSPGYKAIYIDGVLVREGENEQAAWNTQLTTPTTLGRHVYGKIDELRISKTARYGENFTPAYRFETDANTVRLWHMDAGQGEVIEDAVSGLEAPLVGDVDWVTGVSERNVQVR